MIQRQNFGTGYIFPFFHLKLVLLGKKYSTLILKLVLNLNPGFRTRSLVHAFGTGFRSEPGL